VRGAGGLDVNRIRRKVDDILWGPETAARLLIVHVGLAALIGARVALGSYRQLAKTPDALVEPVAVLGWIHSMPPVWVFVAIQLVGTLAAIAAVCRWRVRWTFAVAWLSYLVLAGLRGSRGKVLHNDLLLLWVSAPFLLAPVVARWHGVAELRRQVAQRAFGWPVRAATALCALIYFYAGYNKLTRSGLSWVTGDNMRYVMLWGPRVGSPAWAGLTRWVGEHLWAARGSAAFILAIELSFPVVLFVRRLKAPYAVATMLLHIGTWFLLGLDYWAWALTVPLLLIDWPAVALRVSGVLAERRGEAAEQVGEGALVGD
jgi:hypothetical protein